ncbi:MAG: hypothetical protein MZV64_33775 [Ignavibacteriales bacterium]|nr:hypothetical protein [Ignavibacteriales bacterium]
MTPMRIVSEPPGEAGRRLPRMAARRPRGRRRRLDEVPAGQSVVVHVFSSFS